MHFTYESNPKEHLCQGDILQRTKEVDQLLKDVHPHYCNAPGYDFFLVLTQSCDLVRRDGEQCKSRYISIAAIRPLAKVLERELEKQFEEPVEGHARFASHDRKEKMFQFMERLLNNNEPDYFYLHRAPEFGLNDDYCAFLKLSIAIKAEFHYETLSAARILQLTQNFQHKLGYLVGNIYSRIGTDDWTDHVAKEEFIERTRKPIKELAVWLDKDVCKLVVQILSDIEAKEKRQVRPEDLEPVLEKIKKQRLTKRNEVLNALKQVLQEFGVADGDKQEMICSRFSNRSEFQVLK
jgi:hypothetical protein